LNYLSVSDYYFAGGIYWSVRLKQHSEIDLEAKYSDRIFMAKTGEYLYFLFFVGNGDIGRERIAIIPKEGYRFYPQREIETLLGRRMTDTEIQQAIRLNE